MANSADLDQMPHSAALYPVNSGNFFHWNLLVFHYNTPVYHDNLVNSGEMLTGICQYSTGIPVLLLSINGMPLLTTGQVCDIYFFCCYFFPRYYNDLRG